MPDRLSLHAPVLVNTIGHCAGAIAFGILLYLLLLDWRANPRERSPLPSLAAALALLWNLGSLIGLATSPGDAISDAIVAGSFSVLSVLPAVLLHISLRSSRRLLWIAGYVVSALAVLLHIVDLVTGLPRFHYAAILLVTLGFGTLTAASVILESAAGNRDGSGARLAGAMVLFLFAISFVHFESAHDAKAWSGEIALHHAGIPLALFVLLQDYRFLLLDAFIRFLVNGILAAFTVWIASVADARFALLANARQDPFYAGIVFTLACLALGLFAWSRTRAQRFLTRTVFLRSSVDRSISRLRDLTASSESSYLDAAAAIVAEFFSARRFEIVPAADRVPESAIAVLDAARWTVPSWVQALAPMRFSRGDTRLLLLGSRTGGRRYLSEDIELLDRLSAIATEQVERIRNGEMQQLVSQAELRALQAQINPHFLFNSLNTLYGVIGRENHRARQLVANLAGLFRYSFAADRAVIRIEEELTIVRAYLEIEQLRLGSRLVVELDIDESTHPCEIPVLSIQPLVENAVKHGAASRTGAGFVRLLVRRDREMIKVEISNSGRFGASSAEADPPDSHGVGLANVRRRLALCYGGQSDFGVSSDASSTTVSFSLPVRSSPVEVHS
ncbi:MAG TPA: histidine kinase [Bryobacteraceae bacterium]|nr:histidine kinase [Bryobacteraceae bacterium]